MPYRALQDYYADCVPQIRALERDALDGLREYDSRMAVEDFGMPLNLMLGCSALLVNSEEEGITILAAMLRHGPASSHKGTFDS